MPTAYSIQFSPPFPTLQVGCFRTEEFEGVSDVKALIDTGADGTLVPASILRSIGVQPSYSARMRSHWGEWRLVKVSIIDMSISDMLFPAIEVVADEKSDTILLGRNILNRVILLLDGPGRTTDVLTRRPIRL